MKTCKTCRFMAADRYGLDGYSTGHSTCVRIIHGNGIPPYHPSAVYGDGRRGERREAEDPRKELAAVLDGSGYAARLVVLPTFGCVLHEEPSEGNTDGT